MSVSYSVMNCIECVIDEKLNYDNIKYEVFLLDNLILKDGWGIVLLVIVGIGVSLILFMFGVFLKNCYILVVKFLELGFCYIYLFSILVVFFGVGFFIFGLIVFLCIVNLFFGIIYYNICVLILFLRIICLFYVFNFWVIVKLRICCF